MADQTKYTVEVMAAMREQAALRGDVPPPVPAGYLQYHIAVGDALLQGSAPASTVAAALRGLAEQIERTTTQGEPNG